MRYRATFGAKKQPAIRAHVLDTRDDRRGAKRGGLRPHPHLMPRETGKRIWSIQSSCRRGWNRFCQWIQDGSPTPFQLPPGPFQSQQICVVGYFRAIIPGLPNYSLIRCARNRVPSHCANGLREWASCGASGRVAGVKDKRERIRARRAKLRKARSIRNPGEVTGLTARTVVVLRDVEDMQYHAIVINLANQKG